MMQKTENSLLIQAEIVLIILMGIVALVLDSSFITFSQDMDRVWKIALDPYKFPPLTQLHLKYFLSTLVIVRTFSVHITIALYVVMLWPAIFAEREYLLIPWICVATIRLLVNIMSTVAGLYICSKYGMINTLWFEFLLVQILQHGPFSYVWLTIIKYRFHLKKIAEEREKMIAQEVYQIKLCERSLHKLSEKRKRMIEDQKDLISQSTISTIIDRISTRKKENMSTGSLDTLLELIEKGQHKNEINSINSETFSEQTESDIQTRIMQDLQISNKYAELAKRYQLSSSNAKNSDHMMTDENLKDVDNATLTYDLGSNEIEQENITLSLKSETED